MQQQSVEDFAYWCANDAVYEKLKSFLSMSISNGQQNVCTHDALKDVDSFDMIMRARHNCAIHFNTLGFRLRFSRLMNKNKTSYACTISKK